MNAEIVKKRAAIAASYRRVFGSEEGQIVLADLIRRGHVARPCLVRGDPIASAFNEGQRCAVLTILTLAKINQDRLAELMISDMEKHDL